MQCLKYDRHFSPFSFACYSNSTECFKVLYNHGMQHTTDSDKMIAQWFGSKEDQVECLFGAVRNNNLELLRMLVNDLKIGT